MYVPTPSPPPSPEAQYLSDKIAEAVREFRAGHPGIGDDEVAAAFNLARDKVTSSGAGNASRTVAAVLVAAGLFVAAAGLFFFVRGGGGDLPMILLPLLGIAVGFVFIALKKSTSGPDRNRMLVVMVVTGLLLAGLVAFYLVQRGPGLPLG